MELTLGDINEESSFTFLDLVCCYGIQNQIILYSIDSTLVLINFESIFRSEGPIINEKGRTTRQKIITNSGCVRIIR